jgi:hypothetical protein
MAKKQEDKVHYEPGIIYDLGIMIDGTRIPFYVGETSNAEQRLKDHQRAGKNADESSTLVYRTIKDFDQAGIGWTMKELDKYDIEGPTDLEDEWIMKHLYDGHTLSNMKKGNANWMAERQAAANDMRKREISSYKKYKQVLTQEDADRKHAEWMRKEEQVIVLSHERTKREEERKRVIALMAEQQAEKIRQREIAQVKEAERLARLQSQWEADRPAREARIKAETERLQAEEQRKQEHAEERRRALNALRDQDRNELIERANKNYADWPEEIREYHQRTEDAEVRVMMSQGLTDTQIQKQLEQDKKLHWPPGRVRV